MYLHYKKTKFTSTVLLSVTFYGDFMTVIGIIKKEITPVSHNLDQKVNRDVRKILSFLLLYLMSLLFVVVSYLF